jgi:hypothetical protein
MPEKKPYVPPSLGTTADEIIANWMTLSEDPTKFQPGHAIVGVLVAGGGSYEFRKDTNELKLHRTFPGPVPTIREATKAEASEVERGIERGWVEIQSRAVNNSGKAYPRIVYHQATGSPLPKVQIR